MLDSHHAAANGGASSCGDVEPHRLRACLPACLQAHTDISRLELRGSGSQLPPASVLQRFQHLRALSIASSGTALAGLLLAALQLQQLTELSLEQTDVASNTQPSMGWMGQLPALLPRLLSFQAKLGYRCAFEAPALRALRVAAQLTSLSLSQLYGGLPAAVLNELAAALPLMRSLAALSLWLPALTSEVVSSITQLTALALLDVTCYSACMPSAVLQLTALKRLQRLQLFEGGAGKWWRTAEEPVPEWPAPNSFHSLQSFRLGAPGGFTVSLARAMLRLVLDAPWFGLSLMFFLAQARIPAW